MSGQIPVIPSSCTDGDMSEDSVNGRFGGGTLESEAGCDHGTGVEFDGAGGEIKPQNSSRENQGHFIH
jgi:hypothetical protein